MKPEGKRQKADRSRGSFFLPYIFCLFPFLALCFLYNFTLPMFEASDEASHFRYADYLATERRLPDLTRDLPSHEVTQPVLYYALVALVISPFDRSNLEQINQLNPDWFDKRLNADYRSVKNLHIHTPAEEWPWQGEVWAVHAARLFSSLLGALTLLFVFLIGRQIEPHLTLLAPLATALVAFNLKFIHISSIVSNDIAITLAATVACWWMTKMWRQPALLQRHRGWLVLGALCGLAVLCKLSGVGLLAPVAVLVWMGTRQGEAMRGAWAPIGKAMLLFLVGFGLVAGWWLLFNTLNYGNPLAWEQVRAANAALLRIPPLTPTEIFAAFPRVLESYWGVVGIELDFPRWVHLLFFVGLGLAVLGWFRLARHRRFGNPQGSEGAPWLLLAWHIALLALFVVWLRGYVGTENGRLIMPSVAAVAIGVAAGWLGLVPQQFQKPAAFTSACALFALALATPFWVIRPAFAPPTYLTPQQMALLNTESQPVFGGDVKLLQAQIHQRSVKPGEVVRVSLTWGATQPINQSYRILIEATDLKGDVIGRTYAIPFSGRFATQRWLPGQYFADEYEVTINTNAARGPAAITLSLVALYPEERLLMVNGLNTNALELGKLKVDAPQQTQSPAKAIVGFGGQIELQTVDVNAGVFVWRGIAQPSTDYTLFIHALNAQGKLVWQSDGQPLGGRYPTRLWDAGDVISEKREVNLQDAQRLLVGWYDAQTGQRLPALKPDGTRWADDAVIIWEAPK
jgi:hypothetical protein